eukprot:416508-Amphidinium_carterae.1
MAPASAALASRACAADMVESALPSLTAFCGEWLEEKKEECSGFDYFDWDVLDDAGKGASSGPASDIYTCSCDNEEDLLDSETPFVSVVPSTIASDGGLNGESDELVQPCGRAPFVVMDTAATRGVADRILGSAADPTQVDHGAELRQRARPSTAGFPCSVDASGRMAGRVRKQQRHRRNRDEVLSNYVKDENKREWVLANPPRVKNRASAAAWKKICRARRNHACKKQESVDKPSLAKPLSDEVVATLMQSLGVSRSQLSSAMNKPRHALGDGNCAWRALWAAMAVAGCDVPLHWR